MAEAIMDTQTPTIFSLTPATKSNILPKCKAWGRLYSTYSYLEPVDLENTSFMLGRAENCDVTIDTSKISLNIVANISKTHFQITREDDCLIYITDLSKNGTFLNGQRIGKGVKNILQDDDEISIGLKGLKVYLFKHVNSKQNDFLPPDLRNKYEVSKTLGNGACGEVKLIFDKITCKPYAVKKIDKAKPVGRHGELNDPSKIKSEINILRKLKHPCIVSLHEIVETEKAVYIVLEYMEGGELSNVILTNNGLTENDAKYLFYQIALAVKYLHDNDVTHRDLKPDNVLLKTTSTTTLVKLSDFGLSKMLDENTWMKTICGTPLYVAPEILDRTVKYYDKQVDIWSLGVILFYMLCQEFPFKSDEGKAERNMRILSATYNYNGEKWKDVRDLPRSLIDSMLVVDPSRRLTIEGVLDHPWITSDTAMTQKVTRLIYENAETATLESSCDTDSTSPPSKRSRLS